MDTIRVDSGIAAQHIFANPARDGDHRVCALDRGALAEHGERVTAAQLLGFPGPEWLEAVNGHHVWNRPHQPGKVAAEFPVPGRTMDELGAFARCGHG